MIFADNSVIFEALRTDIPVETQLNGLLGIEYPILLAPMDVISDARLAAAARHAGAFGIFGGWYGERTWLDSEVKKQVLALIRFHLDPVERKARLHSLRDLVKAMTGPRGEAAAFALLRAEISGDDPEMLAEALAAFGRLGTIDQQRALSSFASLHSPNPQHSAIKQ